METPERVPASQADRPLSRTRLTGRVQATYFTAAERLTPRPRWLGAALAAFMLWAIWAAYANAGHGMATAIRTGLVQGTASFAITVYLTLSVTWLFNRCRIHILRPVLPVLGTVAVSGSFLVLLHRLVGTPEVLATVAPPITVAALYCAYVNASLLRTEARRTNN